MIRSLWQVTVGICLLASVALASHADKVTYYHNDALGSPIAGRAPNGGVWVEEYGPYGERLIGESSIDNDIWYTGKQEELGMGVQYFHARWYHPTLGAFLSRDPAGFRGNVHSFNHYAYANNNPYRYIDPTGEIPVETVWDAGNVVIGAASFGSNVSSGNYGGAALDAAGVLVDALATVTPYIPGGAGAAIKASRAADVVSDVAKKADWKSDPDHPNWKKESGPKSIGSDVVKEPTPSTNPELFRNVRGCKGKCNTQTGEIWEPDMLHKDHFEVYKNRKNYDKGKRDRSVWDDGRPKDTF
ncbi:RHS repeat-associated core domain-containing protein [Gilvimarinus sp. F26214L]|uniref:RHS repeat-associated core domain-containing protein n=1 Tax=Gilvimarinus sp. DZF01 TaxID=3461371 RepID=UPI004045ACED